MGTLCHGFVAAPFYPVFLFLCAGFPSGKAGIVCFFIVMVVLRKGFWGEKVGDISQFVATTIMVLVS